MIKKITKLTAIMLLMGAILAMSAVGCMSKAQQEEKFEGWGVDWNGYRPNVNPPSDLPLPPQNNEEDAHGGQGEVIPPSQTTTPSVQPATYSTMIKSETNGLNVRSAPSTGAKILGTLDKGDMVRYAGEQNGWYKTVYKQQTAYVYAGKNYVSKAYMKQGSDKVEKVIAAGEELLGYPYVWGSQRYHWGNGVLNKNFVQGQYDCSALMQYIFYIGAGVLMDLNTRTQVLQGKTVQLSDLQRGDVMFFTNDSRKGYSGVERVGHVALYLGDNYILHTASDHAVIEEISAKRHSYFIVAKRLI